MGILKHLSTPSTRPAPPLDVLTDDVRGMPLPHWKPIGLGRQQLSPQKAVTFLHRLEPGPQEFLPISRAIPEATPSSERQLSYTGAQLACRRASLCSLSTWKDPQEHGPAGPQTRPQNIRIAKHQARARAGMAAAGPTAHFPGIIHPLPPLSSSQERRAPQGGRRVAPHQASPPSAPGTTLVTTSQLCQGALLRAGGPHTRLASPPQLWRAPSTAEESGVLRGEVASSQHSARQWLR